MRYGLTSEGFVGENGVGVRRVLAMTSHADERWGRKQEAGVAEYLERGWGGARELAPTELDWSPVRTTAYLYKLFCAYVALALGEGFPGERPLMLDVGCGVSTSLPPYAGPLKDRCRYVGLDPIDAGGEREYLFVRGALEDLPAALDARFDVFVFVTSLDHFRSVEAAASAARRLAGPRSVALFLVGVHDPAVVARQIGRDRFGLVFGHLGLGHFLRHWIGMSVRGLPTTYLQLRQRQRWLESGRPLDARHFHYFTASELPKALEAFGPLEDMTLVPGTNAVFARCSVDGAR
jgi:SAM-dependent methyltransferase